MAMDSFTFEDDISILTHEALREEGGWADQPNTELTGEEYLASHFALVTAYNDIKQRLIAMERENYSLKRKLRHYDVKFSLSNDFGDELSPRHLDILVLRTENTHLREQLDELHNQLEDSKEREDHLDKVIEAYEKICFEKEDLHQQLEEMSVLAEKHLGTIRSLEQALKQKNVSVQRLNGQLQASQPLRPQPQPHPEPSPTHGLESQGPQCLADMQLTERAVQRLQDRVDELQRQLHDSQWPEGHLHQDLTCDLHDMEWLKNTEEEQVSLALAYTELSEELGRLHSLTEAQTEILRHLSEEQAPNHGSVVVPVCGRIADYASFPRLACQRLCAGFQGHRSHCELLAAPSDTDTLYSQAQYLRVPGDEGGEQEDLGPSQTEYEKHSSEEEEEWMAHSPPGTLSRAVRPTASCLALPIPHHPQHRNNTSYSCSEHAQSWPSINLWMETVDSEIRSCPLCQLAFPLSYPDDALIKHIDTHLENSKI